MLVSIDPGNGVAADEIEKDGSSQAPRTKIMLRKGMSLYFTFIFIETCMRYYLTVIETETLHKVFLLVANTHVDV